MRIIEWFVKNDTPYFGKLKIRFEKNPEYKSVKRGFLNKVHLDLKIFKIVTRLIPEIQDNKLIPIPDKVALIEKYTGGIVVERRVKEKELGDILITKHNFLTKDKRYIGDIFTGWYYFTNQMVSVKESPNGVALVYKEKKPFNYIVLTETENISVGVGDRVFDEKYMPSQADYKREDWKKWYKKFKKSSQSIKKNNKKSLINFIPYNMRGLKKIRTLEEAKEAAIKINNYIKNDGKK